MEIPDGYEGQIRSRSGLVLKEGIFILNSPGTIDSDYRGEIGVILANLSDEPYLTNKGDRIAQLVICHIVRVDVQEVNELAVTQRGCNGFGSTDISNTH